MKNKFVYKIELLEMRLITSYILKPPVAIEKFVGKRLT